MPATNLFTNTVGMTFTPGGGTAAPLNRITKTDIDGGIQNISFKGDANLFPILEVNVSQVPTVTVTGGNVAAIMAGIAGNVGQLTFIWPDAKNGSGVGSFAIQWTLSNAILADKNASAPHAQFATGSNMFSSYSVDGTTNPLAFTIL